MWLCKSYTILSSWLNNIFFKHLRLIYLEDQTQEVFASNDILFDSSSLYYAVIHFVILCKWKFFTRSLHYHLYDLCIWDTRNYFILKLYFDILVCKYGNILKFKYVLCLMNYAENSCSSITLKCLFCLPKYKILN